MTIEWFLFVIFLVMLLFQIINAVNSCKVYKKEKDCLDVVTAKIITCKVEELLHNSEDKEAQDEYGSLNLKDIHYAEIEYTYNEIKYNKKIMIPINKIMECVPGAEIEVVVQKENPDTVVLERYDKQLRNIYIKNVIFIFLTIIFVLYFGFTAFTNIPTLGASEGIEF